MLGIDHIPVQNPLMEHSVVERHERQSSQVRVRLFVYEALIDPLAYDATDKPLEVAVDGLEHRLEIDICLELCREQCQKHG